jgi:hypothetical protein
MEACGDQQWKLNMIACGESGVLKLFLGPKGLGCGKEGGKGEEREREMGLKSSFDMMCSTDIKP